MNCETNNTNTRGKYPTTESNQHQASYRQQNKTGLHQSEGPHQSIHDSRYIGKNAWPTYTNNMCLAPRITASIAATEDRIRQANAT